MVWEIVFMLLVLKIPIVYLCVVIWWAIKGALLRFFVGFTRQERRDAFSSRMDRRYDVTDLVSRYSERRIRITDTIGRRGRFITLAAAGFYYLYLQVAQEHRLATRAGRGSRSIPSSAASFRFAFS